jgi:hypothetical protein
MRQNYSALYLIFLLGLTLLTAGCPPKTIYEVAMDERSVGDLTKDKEIEAKVKTSFADDETGTPSMVMSTSWGRSKPKLKKSVLLKFPKRPKV